MLGPTVLSVVGQSMLTNVASVCLGLKSASWHLQNPRGEGGYSYILAIRICAAGKGMVLQAIYSGINVVIIKNWSRIGLRLKGSLSGH